MRSKYLHLRPPRYEEHQEYWIIPPAAIEAFRNRKLTATEVLFLAKLLHSQSWISDYRLTEWWGYLDVSVVTGYLFRLQQKGVIRLKRFRKRRVGLGKGTVRQVEVLPPYRLPRRLHAYWTEVLPILTGPRCREDMETIPLYIWKHFQGKKPSHAPS